MSGFIPLWFIYLLLGNAVVVLVYVVWSLQHKRKDSGSWESRACVMLLCPLVGACCVLLSWLLYRLVIHYSVDLSDVIFSKERVQSVTMAEEELERNVVPLEEAIAVTDKRKLRELMLNVVRDDYWDSLPSIALALNSKDSETAHYAASILQDALNEFRTDVQKDYQRIMYELEDQEQKQSSSGDTETRAAALIEFMNEMLQKHLFTPLEQGRYTHLMDEVGEKLYHCPNYNMDNSLLEDIALRLLEIEDFQLCEKWCLRNVELYPDTLSCYTARLKLYFSNGEREKFFNVLESLKKSDIVVDRETLEFIRAFS